MASQMTLQSDRRFPASYRVLRIAKEWLDFHDNMSLKKLNSKCLPRLGTSEQ